MEAPRFREQELSSAIEELFASSRAGPDVTGVLTRLTKTFVRDLLRIEPGKFKNLTPAMDDHEALVYLVLQAIENEPLQSREAIMKLKGRMAFRALLSKHGGVYSQKQVAELLGLTSGGVRKRVERKKLLAVKQGDHYVYPAFQFGDDGETVSEFDTILQLLDTDSDVAQVRFFLLTNADLGKPVIEALKDGDNLELLRRKATTFGKQGAT